MLKNKQSCGLTIEQPSSSVWTLRSDWRDPGVQKPAEPLVKLEPSFLPQLLSDQATHSLFLPAPLPPIHQQVLPTPSPLWNGWTEFLVCIRHCQSLPCPPLESLPARVLLITAVSLQPFPLKLLWSFFCLPPAAAHVCSPFYSQFREPLPALQKCVMMRWAQFQSLCDPSWFALEPGVSNPLEILSPEATDPRVRGHHVCACHYGTTC